VPMSVNFPSITVPLSANIISPTTFMPGSGCLLKDFV